jgi:uncharacterized membrane protein YeiB
MRNAKEEGSPGALAPLGQGERIDALDVIRGFALLGIFLMNVEWFNRPIADLGGGLPADAHGIDYAVGWLVQVFVRGKFWTLFSLLFGMGFAVMLGRAEQSGRGFVVPYLRRIAALAVFGAAHFIFLWGGDILFSYALGAMALLLLFHAKLPWILPAAVACFGLAAVPKMGALGAVGATLGTVAVIAVFMRREIGQHLFARRWNVLARWHVLTLVAWPIAALLLGLSIAKAILPMGVAAVVVALAGWLATRYHQPASKRSLRAGLFFYLGPFLTMTLMAGLLLWQPQLRQADDAKQKAAQEKQRTEHVEELRKETQVMTGDSYMAAVRYRAAEFPQEAAQNAGFAGLVLAVFLIGVWFVRSGIMARTGDHLPLFRRLAFIGLPIGLAMGIVGTLVADTHIAGQNDTQFRLAMGLQMVGNLPASLGYASLIVLMLHSGMVLAKVSLLAPVGRMALTHYLMQSLIQCVFFYGFFMGHWGFGRAWQMVFVLVVFALQVIFSHWWLAKFRYGPMEWLWRSITYWKPQPMRRSGLSGVERAA